MPRSISPEAQERMDRLAGLVAEGVPVLEAGMAHLGMTKGQTARSWSNIKSRLGEQAC